MSRQIFVNLPVQNLDKTVEFFTRLGFGFNHQFTDENATCMLVNDDAFVMLLVEEFFRGFTSTPVPDPRAQTEAILAISADSRAQVDDLVDSALAAGGGSAGEPADHGFMYVRSFRDLDGHFWEVVYMDSSALPG